MVTWTMPACVPRNQKDAVLAPEAMSTDPAGALHAALVKKAKPALGAAFRVTVVRAATALAFPKESRASIPTAGEHCPATALAGGVAKAMRSGAPAATVS